MESNAEEAVTAYEQPLNERARTLLRLEFLFRQADFALQGESPWHSRLGVHTLVELMELLGRGDLRSELNKELDRLLGVLAPLRRQPGVDDAQLDALLQRLEGCNRRLKALPGAPGGALKQDELLVAVLQRSGVAGGTCGFDLPAYHHWLHRHPRERLEQLQRWLSTLSELREAGETVLSLYRQSANIQSLNAEDGSYQRKLPAGAPGQLIRVLLPAESRCHAVISGSKHFITVRFLQATADGGGRAERVSDTVHFHLQCCMI
ncbi:cell division protein ZapD [Alkalilimnicola sp. S0819]|uniref:cell division protein ZapD n=1 Tax=Alkalilimnicola sp. S0819 TaxID=2613922 RepID=UPI00186A60D0|nr:cell division protein ZapD [Alkalilimnicola sp. S0819]